MSSRMATFQKFKFFSFLYEKSVFYPIEKNLNFWKYSNYSNLNISKNSNIQIYIFFSFFTYKLYIRSSLQIKKFFISKVGFLYYHSKYRKI